MFFAAVSRQLSAVSPKGCILSFLADVSPATHIPQSINTM